MSTILRKAIEHPTLYDGLSSMSDIWKKLMLSPQDYGNEALHNQTTRKLMEKFSFEHGGPEYDKRYPDGIPTSVIVKTKDGKTFDSKLIMYPPGHARNTEADLKGILKHKFALQGNLAMEQEEFTRFVQKLENIENLTNKELQDIYYCNIKYAQKSIDA